MESENLEQRIRLLSELYPDVPKKKLKQNYMAMVRSNWEVYYKAVGGKHAVCICQVQNRIRGRVMFIDSLISDGGGLGEELLDMIHDEYEGIEIELRCPLQRSQAQSWYHKKGFNITGFTMGKVI